MMMKNDADGTLIVQDEKGNVIEAGSNVQTVAVNEETQPPKC